MLAIFICLFCVAFLISSSTVAIRLFRAHESGHFIEKSIAIFVIVLMLILLFNIIFGWFEAYQVQRQHDEFVSHINEKEQELIQCETKLLSTFDGWLNDNNIDEKHLTTVELIVEKYPELERKVFIDMIQYRYLKYEHQRLIDKLHSTSDIIFYWPCY